MSAYIGIDFGTTNSCAYQMNRGHPKATLSKTGSPLTPSSVAFIGDDVYVGKAAKVIGQSSPFSIVSEVEQGYASVG